MSLLPGVLMECAILADLRQKRYFSWEPTIDTGVAFLTAIAWIGAYFLLTHISGRPVSTIYEVAVLLLIVLVPIWWLCWHRGRPLRELGIKTQYWREGLLISVIVAIPFFWLVYNQYASIYGRLSCPTSS